MPDQIEWIDGFDEYAAADLALKYTSVGSVTVNTASPVVEGRYVGMTNNQRMTLSVPADDRYTVGFHYCPQGGGSASTDVILLQESTTIHGILTIRASTGYIEVSRNGSIPASATVSPFLPLVWRFIEVTYTVHDSAGSWEVRVDGVTVIGPTSSLDTRNGGTSGIIDTIRLGCGLSQEALYMDNLYVASGSAGFQGEGRCATDVPIADGALTDYTASAGNRFECVDEIPQNGDTDYVSSGVVGNRQTFDMATFGVTGTIKAVSLSLIGRKTDVGARTVTASLRRSSTNQDHGTAWGQLVAYSKFDALWVLDPFTGVDWVDSDIDSTECGMLTG